MVRFAYCVVIKIGEFLMQIKELNSLGYEVILVTSGAVGVGRQRLRYRQLINSRLFLLSHFV